MAAIVLFIIWRSCWPVLCSHSISGNISGVMLGEYMPSAVALPFSHFPFHTTFLFLFFFSSIIICIFSCFFDLKEVERISDAAKTEKANTFQFES